jgi:Flp pilus assembly protein TadG
VTHGAGPTPAGPSTTAEQDSRPSGRGAAGSATWGRGTGSGAGPAAAEPEPWVGERGAAVVELLVVFLTLLLPLVYVMVVMADVQRALLATSSAAREAGRVYVTGSDRVDAERRAGVAYRDVLAAYGIGAGDSRAGMRLQVGCAAGVGPGCAGGFGPGAEVRVVVTYRVPVARLPFLGAVAGPGLTVGATHHTRVDRYRGLSG